MADSNTTYNAVIEGQIPVAEVEWDNFAQPLINLNNYITCDDRTPLAEAVLEAYDIPYDPSGYSFRYGTLPDMDIKRMDAMTVIRNSLMEESFAGSTDRFIETIVTAEGMVKFVEVGGDTSRINDVYYSVQTGQYVDEPKGVMVNGGKPVPQMQPLRWSPIWITAGETGAPIYAAKDMLENCSDANWKSFATIVFDDPVLTTTYEDGIDNLYEIGEENPWDEVLGYAVVVNPGPEADYRTNVQYNSEAEIPLKIATRAGNICPIGNLQNVPQYDTGADPNCFGGLAGDPVDYEDGVPVEIPEEFRYENERGTLVDKFINISNVYIIGEELDGLYARPKDNASALLEMTEANSDIWVTQNSSRVSSYKLDEGKHYVVAYRDLEGDGYPEISIVFGQEVRPHDKIKYGNGEGAGVEYRIDPFCQAAQNEEFGEGGEGTVKKTILPWNRTKGIVVHEIWVTARVETPSITVHHPDGENNRALVIAEQLQYYITPLVMRSPPAPIGYQGGFAGPIDQVPQQRDNNPRTAQDFEDTDYEKAMDEMQGSGMTVTFGFLNGDGDDADAAYESAAEEAQQAAETIYSMINNDVTETVYTCGPDAEPELCDAGPAGGIINSIRYAYSDQGSYTISVTEGPTLIGNLVQVDGGPTEKMAEDYGAKAFVTQALGDNLHFKVRIDGFGERWAVNTSHHIIRERDLVQCTVHNNPVEA